MSYLKLLLVLITHALMHMAAAEHDAASFHKVRSFGPAWDTVMESSRHFRDHSPPRATRRVLLEARQSPLQGVSPFRQPFPFFGPLHNRTPLPVARGVRNPGRPKETTQPRRSMHLGSVGVLRTSAGAIIDTKTANKTLNTRLINNRFFLESITHFVRERTPVRVVHPKGTGAFGYFEVTHDISDICKAKLFSEVGKRTQVGVRFSITFSESGSSDSSRDSRGFAVKFYTEDGNFDFVGFSTPMFGMRDPVLFTSFVHVQQRNPATHVLDTNRLWDLITLRPESMNSVLFLLGDQGVPYGYRHMPGFAIHTYQVVNKDGDIHFVKFHFNPDAGIQNLRSEDAIPLGGIDPDFAIKDLYNSIETGDYPSWTLGVQVLSMDDVKNAKFDVFDITQTWNLTTYPLRPVGRLVLNRNPRNFFAEIEQMAFCPGNLVPGILGSPDKLFEARVLAYRDAHNYRLGANFNKIKVNQPIKTPSTYNRDGKPPVDDNESDLPNYYPNSFNGPQPYMEENKVDLINVHEGPPNNFNEIITQYNEYTEDEKTRLVQNIVGSVGLATQAVQERAVELFEMISSDLSSRVSEGLQNTTAVDYGIEPLL